jgi:hypothetical protein
MNPQTLPLAAPDAATTIGEPDSQRALSIDDLRKLEPGGIYVIKTSEDPELFRNAITMIQQELGIKLLVIGPNMDLCELPELGEVVRAEVARAMLNAVANIPTMGKDAVADLVFEI